MKRTAKIFSFIVVLIGLILLASCANRNFSVRKVSKIELGDTKVKVEEVLGAPYEYEKGATSYEYFSKNYIKLKEKIEKNAEKLLEASSEKELEEIFEKDQKYTEKEQTMEYKYIYITFRDDLVSSILFDAKKVGETSQKKTPKTTTIIECEIPQYLKNGEVTYETYFEDGSYIKGTSPVSVAEGEDVSKVGNEVKIHWSDTFVEQYSETTTIVENKDLVSGEGYYVLDNTLYINKDNVGHFSSDVEGITHISVEEGVTNIPAEAYSNFPDVYKVTLPTTLTSIGKDAFANTAYIQNENNYENGLLYYDNYLLAANPNFSGKLTIKENAIIAEDVFDNLNITSLEIENIDSLSFDLFDYIPKENLEEVIITGGTSIKESAFKDCSSLTKITIPNSVTSIGESAFSGCSNIESVTIPAIVIPFISKQNLKEVIITGGTFIKTSAFFGCSSLVSVIIPNSITSIGESAFTGCSSLENITIPDSVTSIGNDAFFGCSNLASITIPNSVTSIGEYAFTGCSKFTSITIPNSVTSIGEYAFTGCSSLGSITIGDGVTSIMADAFTNCSSLTNVYYEGSIENWCSITFDYSHHNYLTSNPMYYASHFYLRNSNNEWEEVTSIEIPNTITKIGAYQFYGFNNVTSIKIPNSVTRIANAFSDCSSLINVYYEGTIEDWCNISFSSISSSNPMSYLSHFFIRNSNNEWEEVTSIEIPNTIIEIGEYQFDGFSKVTSIIIPNSVTSIGEHAFSNCSSLTSITIGNSVTSIGGYAFDYCSSLTNIYYEGSIEDWCKLNYSIFIESSSSSCHFYLKNSNNEWEEVTSIEIPNTITEIGRYQFYRFNNVTSITIPNSVTSIGYHAFEACSSLTSITIPNSITSIGDSVFYECSSLTNIVIPESVTSIGDLAFCNCYKLVEVYNLSSLNIKIGSKNNGYAGDYAKVIHASLEEGSYLIYKDDYVFYKGKEDKYYLVGYIGKSTKLVLPNDIEGNPYEIYEYCFYKCDSLESITIPASVTTIGKEAFYGCTNLTSIIIPNSVTSIGEEAFYGCTNLTSITIPNSVTRLLFATFSDCSNLTSITIPESVTSIVDSAFHACLSLTEVYYTSTKWKNITIFSDNSYLINATWYYYSETKPTTTGNYWHYVNGVVTKW